MSEMTKIFEYQENGLSYTVTVYELDGAFFADVTVNEGAMDVNAVYFGDDTLSGSSASMKGPLTMNGGGSVYEGAAVQWDAAVKLSDPGLGPEGEDKETFVATGDTLTISLDIDSLDDIDFFGIRATSTTTDAGSIKGVSGDPEITEDPGELIIEESGAPTFDQVFFDYGLDGTGAESGGVMLLADEPETNPDNNPVLPEDTEPTFDNFIAHYVGLGGDITQVDSLAFYTTDSEGVLQVSMELDAPEGGFADTAAVLETYNAAIDVIGVEIMDSFDLAALLTDPVDTEEPIDEEDPFDPEEVFVI